MNFRNTYALLIYSLEIDKYSIITVVTNLKYHFNEHFVLFLKEICQGKIDDMQSKYTTTTTQI